MSQIDTLDESTARREFQKAVKEFGYSLVKIELIPVDGGCPVYRITINA